MAVNQKDAFCPSNSVDNLRYDVTPAENGVRQKWKYRSSLKTINLLDRQLVSLRLFLCPEVNVIV